MCCAASRWVGILAFLFASMGCSVSSSHSDGGAPADGGAHDAPPADAAGDGRLPCEPMNTLSFVPPLTRSEEAGAQVCVGQGGDGGVVKAYGDACIGHLATFETCGSFVAPDAGQLATCYECVVTAQSDAAAYGAVVAGVIPFVNYAGCIEAADPTPAGALCARYVYQAAECADYACRTVCPIVDDPSDRAYVNCYNLAWTTVCAGYGNLANNCIVDERVGAAEECFPEGGTTEDDYLSITRVLCGS